jgi:aromatic-L-amino-acid decarboxylase
MIAGIARGPEDRERVRLVPTDASFAMDCGALARMVAEDAAAGKWPCFVCATVGTTGMLGFDRIAEVAAAVAIAKGVWVHVDAAHAGSACVCPEFRWMIEGVERADSLCFNPHKWLLTNFDCDCLWVREKSWLVDALSITPEYLRNPASESGAVTDFRDLQVPLGRRFRALKLWFVIRYYGLEGLRAHIREHVRIAGIFEGLVRADDHFELVGERRLNLVCFRLSGEGPEVDARNKRLLEAINASGRAYLTHTVYEVGGVKKYVLRMAIGATRTRERHVRAAWELVQECLGSLDRT